MTTRRRDRKLALEILYEIDMTGRSLKDVLENKKHAGVEIALSEFAARLIAGVIQMRERIDRIIEQFSEGWKVSRMPSVDRNILRMAIYEMIFEDEVPIAVSINEAVELAKFYSTDDARRFINGVLGRISKELGRIAQEVRTA
jgi:N utilization substance protein B